MNRRVHSDFLFLPGPGTVQSGHRLMKTTGQPADYLTVSRTRWCSRTLYDNHQRSSIISILCSIDYLLVGVCVIEDMNHDCVTCWTRRCPRCFQTESTPAQVGWISHTDRWCGPGNPGGEEGGGGGRTDVRTSVSVNKVLYPVMSHLVQQEADWRHCDGTDSNLITFCLAYRLETLFIFDVMTCYDIDYWFSVTQQLIVDWFILTFWIKSHYCWWIMFNSPTWSLCNDVNKVNFESDGLCLV